jgi:hypothetical protein
MKMENSNGPDDSSMEVGPEQIALANICINLAISVSNWPPKLQDRLRDLQRRFALIHATMLERVRLQNEVAARQPPPVEEDAVDRAVKIAEEDMLKAAEGLGNAAGRMKSEGMYYDTSAEMMHDDNA